MKITRTISLIAGYLMGHGGGLLVTSKENLDLIIAVIDKELTMEICEKLEENGVYGFTIFPGRGRSSRERVEFFGITMEPQREAIFIVSPKEKTEELYEIILEEGNLNSPGKGLILVLDVQKAGGLNL